VKSIISLLPVNSTVFTRSLVNYFSALLPSPGNTTVFTRSLANYCSALLPRFWSGQCRSVSGSRLSCDLPVPGVTHIVRRSLSENGQSLYIAVYLALTEKTQFVIYQLLYVGGRYQFNFVTTVYAPQVQSNTASLQSIHHRFTDDQFIARSANNATRAELIFCYLPLTE